MFSLQIKGDEIFYDAYKKQFPKTAYRTNKAKHYTEEYLYQLKVLTDRYYKKTGHSFFEKDTIYLIAFRGAETAFMSGVIWNRSASLSFRQINWATAKERSTDRVITQKMDATNEIRSYNKDFISTIVKADTDDYHRYAVKHKALDGEYVSPVVCIRNKGMWRFIDFPGNEWGITYDM